MGYEWGETISYRIGKKRDSGRRLRKGGREILESGTLLHQQEGECLKEEKVNEPCQTQAES